jgi:hypothetical protein
MADNLLREVDEALRAERAASLWNTHKRTLMAIGVALVLAVAGKSGWHHYREAKGGSLLLELSQARDLMLANKPAEAAKAFATIADDTSGEQRALALVWQSRAEQATGENAAATEALKHAVTTGQSLWSDIACLRLAGLDAAAAEACLNNPADSPLIAQRQEWAAAIDWKNGNADAAMAALKTLAAREDISPDRQATIAQWIEAMQPDKTKE